MNEFDETPRIYVWPQNHEDGTAFPDDFQSKLSAALEAAGIEWEWV